MAGSEPGPNGVELPPEAGRRIGGGHALKVGSEQSARYDIEQLTPMIPDRHRSTGHG